MLGAVFFTIFGAIQIIRDTLGVVLGLWDSVTKCHMGEEVWTEIGQRSVTNYLNGPFNPKNDPPPQKKKASILVFVIGMRAKVADFQS